MRGQTTVIRQAYKDQLDAHRLNEHTTCRCHFCNWTFEGCLYHARQAHQAHRTQHHPNAISSRRPHKTRRFQMSDKPVELNIAEARKQGAATWDGAAA